jgi:iron(III) transport system ATP-binding protein
MSHYARQYPHALSGGEQQRVALARALAPRPSVLLMDEPFSGLDSRLKDSVRSETLAILRETGATTVVVTHDAEEAMRMADSIALLNNGQVVQTGNAEELYYRPANLFAAGFLSDINILHARVSGGKTETPLGSFQASRFRDGENVTVAIRLSDIEVSESKGTIPARIVYRRFLGVFDLFALSVPGLDGMVRVRALAGSLKSDLHDVMLYVNERDILMFKSA